MISSVVNVFFKVTQVCHGKNLLRFSYFRAFVLESVDVEQTFSQLPLSGRYTNFILGIKGEFPETMSTNEGLASQF